MKQVEVDLEATGQCEPGDAEMAVNVFDFSQNLPVIWRGSHNARKREILNCVSLNRTLSDVSLVLEKRRPFEILSEGPFVQSSRGDWRSFEPWIAALVDTALSPSAEALVATRVVRLSA